MMMMMTANDEDGDGLGDDDDDDDNHSDFKLVMWVMGHVGRGSCGSWVT